MIEIYPEQYNNYHIMFRNIFVLWIFLYFSLCYNKIVEQTVYFFLEPNIMVTRTIGQYGKMIEFEKDKEDWECYIEKIIYILKQTK